MFAQFQNDRIGLIKKNDTYVSPEIKASVDSGKKTMKMHTC